MQPTLCSRCKKNVAMIYVTKIENGVSHNEGLCLSCAKALGLKPLEDMMQKMGISDEDLENLTQEMMSSLSPGEEPSELAEISEDDSEEENDGRTATFPFLNRLFSSSETPASPPPPHKAEEKPGKTEGRQVKRKFLENYCISLTARAAEGKLDKIVGRESEIARTIQILNRRQKNNPCLIGEPGVGKTAIAEGLAQKIFLGQVPYKLQDKEVYMLDLTALVAGTQFRGQFESRMKGLIDEVKKLGNIILVIDEVHSIVGAGDAEGSMNAANILKPALSRGEIQVIGATTLTEYRKHIEKDSALERRFQPVIVEEPSIDESVEILKGIAPYYENFHHVVISPAMARLAVTMSERYITDRYLPDKAIDLIDEACSDVNLHNKSLARQVEIDRELADLAKEREVVLAATGGKSDSQVSELIRQEIQLQRRKSSLEATLERMSGEEGEDAEQQRQDCQRQLESLQNQLAELSRQRQQLQSETADKAYRRLAHLKSQELQLNTEKEALTAEGDPALTVEHLARVIELWTKIPASQIQEQEYERLAHLEDRLKTHIIGQDEAVRAVSSAVRRGRVGISAKHKPVSFIFVGPTGVGKTELVKRLAQDLFSTPDSLIRLDMSEFMEKHSVSRIIGSPPGYVGYDDAGQLTEKVRRKPYCVILFDEIEKAHPDVLNILLQILDDGRITDAHGKAVNFENTVIVMTSNAGSDNKGGGSVGFGRTASEQGREKAMKALEGFLRPEFINRVDEIVCFNRLEKDSFRAIARIMVEELAGTLAEKGITFTYEPSLLDYLVDKSFSQTYGARNLRRLIQKELEDAIASRIIESYQSPITQLRASATESGVSLLAL
ncbi:MAG: ATP-dependent Clp protease ATP-binding subunit [Oscillospiraceae bacterium]|nr:ATP-dependent Clp protease ATP-binding subunit [Oscillospiraceae bacterium]